MEAAGGDPQNDTSILDNAYWRGGSGGGWGANSVEETNAQAGASDGGSRGNNIGQGTTTRAFGESSGALYAGGGGGGGSGVTSGYTGGGAGGSGIVIVRWGY